MDVDIGEKDFYGCACLRVSGDEIQIIKWLLNIFLT